MADVLLNKVYLFLTKCSVVWLFVDYHQFKRLSGSLLPPLTRGSVTFYGARDLDW